MTYSPIVKWSLQDTDGVPIVGGTFEFYQAGTSTPKNVFSDSDRSVSLGDTLTTDSRGEVGPVYLDTEVASKVIAKDADGNTLWTEDNLTPPEGLSASLNGYSVSPLDYGAVGDGVADETSAVQSALDAAVGDVNLADKTYRIDSKIDISDGTVIRNGTLDATQNGGNRVIEIWGSEDAVDLLTSDSSAGTLTIAIASTTDYAVGDYVLIRSTQGWESGTSGRGEIARVRSLTSTVLTVEAPFRMDFLTSSGASVAKLNMRKNIRFENVRILCATASSQDAFSIRYAENVVVRDCSVDDVHSAGVYMRYAVNCKVDGFLVSESGAAVEVFDSALSCSVNRITAFNCTNGVEVGNPGSADGICDSVTVTGVHAEGCTIGVLLGGLCVDCSMDSIVVRDGSTGVGMKGSGCSATAIRCTHNTLQGISIDPTVGEAVTYSSDKNRADFVLKDAYVEFCAGDGVKISSDGSAELPTRGIHLSDIRVAGAGGHGVHFDGRGGQVTHDINIDGLHVTDVAAGKRAFYMDTSELVDGLRLHRVVSDGGIEVDCDTADEVVSVSIVGCDCDGGIDLEHCKDVSIVGCLVDDSAEALSQAVILTDCHDVTISGGQFIGVIGVKVDASEAGATSSGISIHGSVIKFTTGSGVSFVVSGTSAIDGCTLSGAHISPYGSPSSQVAGVTIVGGTNLAKNIAVSGTYILSDDDGIEITGDVERINVHGCDINVSAFGVKVGTGTDTSTMVLVVGNLIRERAVVGSDAGVYIGGLDFLYFLAASNVVYGFNYSFQEDVTNAVQGAMLGNNYAIEYNTLYSDGTFDLGAFTDTTADIKNGRYNPV